MDNSIDIGKISNTGNISNTRNSFNKFSDIWTNVYQISNIGNG